MKLGGIHQKVIAADKAGAEIFLAPNEDGKKDSNYQMRLKRQRILEPTWRLFLLIRLMKQSIF